MNDASEIAVMMGMKKVYGYIVFDTLGLIGFMNALIQSGHRLTDCALF